MGNLTRRAIEEERAKMTPWDWTKTIVLAILIMAFAVAANVFASYFIHALLFGVE
jgi:hypothetical protein